MLVRSLLSLVLILFIGCSTTPINYDKPVKADDYKYFYKLKEEKHNPVSKKTTGQKIKDVFTKKPAVKTTQVQQAKTNKVQIKKSRPLFPTRKIRKTNTSPVTNTTPVLLANTRVEEVKVKKL